MTDWTQLNEVVVDLGPVPDAAVVSMGTLASSALTPAGGLITAQACRVMHEIERIRLVAERVRGETADQPGLKTVSRR